MRKLLVPLLVFLCWLSQIPPASAQCGGREEISSAFSRADFVFSGHVIALDPILAKIQVDKIWKGEERSEIVMRTGTIAMERGFMSSSERITYAIGREYVIYASGKLDDLEVPICRRSGVLTAQETEALDKITPHRKIGTEIHRCSTTGNGNTSEFRLTISSSGEIAMPGARVNVDSATQHYAALTRIGGHATVSGIPAGQYKVTSDLDGYTPRQLTVTVPENACIEADLFLSPAIEERGGRR